MDKETIRKARLGDPQAIEAIQRSQEREAQLREEAAKEQAKEKLRFDTESPEQGFTIAQLKTFKCALCGGGFNPQLRSGQTGQDDERPFISGGIVSVNDGGKLEYYHGYQSSGCYLKWLRSLGA